jgi:hypothetical protein
MRTVKRRYHISYDNIHLFEELIPPLLVLCGSLEREKGRIQKASNWRLHCTGRHTVIIDKEQIPPAIRRGHVNCY